MRRLAFVLALTFTLTTSQAQDWVQSGNTIFGAAEGDNHGRGVAINENGTIVAVGSPQSDILGTETGQVRVYQLQNNQWIQMGSVFNGVSAYTYFGESVKLSKDGKTIVMSSAVERIGGVRFGSIRVYTWNETSWVQKGTTIFGPTANGYFGTSIGISDDGNTLASLAYIESNKVRLYQWNTTNNNWEQKGSTIIGGDNATGVSGGSIDLSGDGNTIILGLPSQGTTNDIFGRAKVFSWDGTSWIQKGADFTGNTNEKLGRNVNINGDGSVIAIGIPNRLNNGQLKVYYWDGTTWLHKGQDFNGTVSITNQCCFPNFASALDNSGNTFAYWSYTNDDPRYSEVKTFQWDGTSWLPKGTNIEGGNGDNMGVNYLDLNYDGNGLVIGFPYDYYFNDGIHTGRTKVYRWDTNLNTTNTNTSALTVYPIPVKNVLVIESDIEILKVDIFSVDGKKVRQQLLNNQSISLESLSNGIYLVQLTTANGIMTKRICKE